MIALILLSAYGRVIPLKNQLNTLYTMKVSIGTPPQSFTLAIDTTSPVTSI